MSSAAPQLVGEAAGQRRLSLDVVAFVGDSETVAVLEGLCSEGELACHIEKGKTRDAIRFFNKGDVTSQLLIVDVGGSDMPLSMVDALAEVCDPTVKVVVIGDQQDVGLFRELMRIGVSDYLVKPVSADLLRPHLTVGGTNATRGLPTRSGKLVVVTGTRGGAGATTVTAALGRMLADDLRRRVVLVDLDPYGGALAAQLDLPRGGLTETLQNAQRLDPLFMERTLIAKSSHLFLLSAEAALDEDVPLRPDDLAAVFEALRKQFHYVLVDLPRRPGPAYAYVLGQASTRIIVGNRTLPSARDFARLIQLASSGGGRAILALNDNQQAGRGRIEKRTLEESLGHTFDLEIGYDRAVPHRMDDLGEAAGGKGPLLQGIKALADSLSGTSKARPTGWRRLFARA